MGVIVWAKRVLLVLLGILGSALTVCVLVYLSWTQLKPQGVQALEEQLRFPFEVPDTTLVARDLVEYEDVSALLLENKGTVGISCARVILQWAEGAYVFDVDMLPPKAKVLVPEREAQAFDLHRWTKCVGVQLTSVSDWTQTAVDAQPVESTKLKLTNVTGETLEEVYLYFKKTVPEEEWLLGGEVERIPLGDLLPGEVIYLEPYGFSWEDCKIVRICSQQEY